MLVVLNSLGVVELLDACNRHRRFRCDAVSHRGSLLGSRGSTACSPQGPELKVLGVVLVSATIRRLRGRPYLSVVRW